MMLRILLWLVLAIFIVGLLVVSCTGMVIF
jgi:hypothetical protein